MDSFALGTEGLLKLKGYGVTMTLSLKWEVYGTIVANGYRGTILDSNKG